MRKKGIENIKCCKFLVQFAGNLFLRVTGKQSSLNLSIFLFFFLFYRNVSEFFEFASSLRFFSTESSVEFSFS